MTLEEEIKQSHFPNEVEKALVNVIFTANFLHNQNLKRFKKHGISPEQFNVLRILRGSHPKKLRLADISSRMLDRNSNATRLVEKLRLKNLVTRDNCEKDRRQVDIGITQNGLDVLALIDVESKQWFEKQAFISKDEAKTINLLLDKMRG